MKDLLLAKETPNFNWLKIQDFVLEHDLKWTAWTGFEEIGLSGNSLSRESNSLFFMLGEFLTKPYFKTKLLEEEKKVVIQEMCPKAKLEKWIEIERETQETIFRTHPLARTTLHPIGTIH
jgi:predicted Zn-dependent peptidase